MPRTYAKRINMTLSLSLPRAASPQRGAVSSWGQEHYGEIGKSEMAARGLQREAAHLAIAARRHLRPTFQCT